MTNCWTYFEEYPLYQDSRKNILISIQHLTETNLKLVNFDNIFLPEKYKISQKCKELHLLPPMPVEINKEQTLKSMTDNTSDAKGTEKAKVKKLRRKIHLEKSESSTIRKALLSNFPQNSLKGKSKRIEISRLRRSAEDISFSRKFRFSLETSPPSNGNKEEFTRHLTHELAKRMRVPIPSIQDLTIISGTNVEFTLSVFNDENNAMDNESVYDAVEYLEKKIKTHQLRITDTNGQLLMTTMDDNSFDFSHVILIVLCITLVMIVILIFILVYISRRLSSVSKAPPTDSRNEAYKSVNFGRDSSISIGKYSYDSGLWLGPGPEPAFTVPDAPYYRPPTVEQIARTPRPVTAVRTRLKKNWDVDERALSTIPDDNQRQIFEERNHRH